MSIREQIITMETLALLAISAGVSRLTVIGGLLTAATDEAWPVLYLEVVGTASW
jgi:hypothetical protein